LEFFTRVLSRSHCMYARELFAIKKNTQTNP
jgi:hypothetical protein